MPKIRWIDVGGFRAFGSTPQHLEFSTNLAVIIAPNSQGKTSLAEAVEFLVTGRTVRRELLGGAKVEYTECLRNVHIPADEPVFVKAGIEDDKGAVHEVLRVLVADYTAQDDCRSILTVDGAVATQLNDLGIVLSEPPLQAPVLMHHTLRWALAAGPQSRADYFKAVLEVQDLENVRDEVNGLLQAPELNPAVSRIVATLQECERTVAFAAAARGLRTVRPTERAVLDAISEGFADVLRAEGHADVPDGLDARAAVLRQLRDARRQASFPVAALDVGTVVTPLPATTFDDVRAFNAAAQKVSEETARLRQLFEAVLAVPSVAAVKGAARCPVCLTPDALTPERVAEIRRQVEGAAGFQNAARRALQELSNAKQRAESARRESAAARPPATAWTEEEAANRRGDAVALSIGAGEHFDAVVSALAVFRGATDDVGQGASDSVEQFDGASRSVERGAVVDIEQLAGPTDTLARAVVAVQTARAGFLEARRQFLEVVQPEIDKRANVAGWELLLTLAEAGDELAGALLDQRAVVSVRQDLGQAVTTIDAAKAAVLDERFAAMSDEIGRWWEMLRPGEAVAFGGVKRRGTGRRYLDLTAALYPRAERPAGDGGFVERHAVAVFSDSQLNCLGMSAFLARCTRHKTPFVVLDDPVPASDEEHQATFSRYVVEALLAQGTQVLVTTHDERVSKQLQDYYNHVPADVFAFILDEPNQGAVAVKKSDELAGMLAAAQPFVRNQNPEIRKNAGQRLRTAAERLCKEIAVRGRKANGEAASLTDYDGKTLSDLSPVVQAFLTKDPAHPGKMRVLANLLNPGSHDAPVPPASDLGVAMGDIKKFKSDYLS